MGTPDLVALAVGLAALVVAGALVPTLLELRRAARSLDRTLLGLGDRLPALLERTDRLLVEAASLLADVRAGVERVGGATGTLREPFARLAGAVLGLRAAAETLVAGRPRGPAAAGSAPADAPEPSSPRAERARAEPSR